ncbi:oxidoreductase-like protein [Strigomonas culicis]|uniref:Oxidoreductase-like protein n=2 Tax=Strigomonas culicis TaxID=28005 RepID=S9TWV1_9TRYP|nr:oxidoreductase-like protein [Strigomonas culicis]EPY23006.1 oxidoreductase-like protein [Strigomonas culicis]EPY36636.1 oxidoreductase-like protein [Strigomonas culicis]|eukprot:EPY22972.1 oxidoreductase-like protein [Strigomonas culicis]
MPSLRRPREPRLGECCGSGCARCVWDVYYDALEAYEEKKRTMDPADLEEEEEEEDSSSLSDASSAESDYIGSVVVKFIPQPDERMATLNITKSMDKFVKKFDYIPIEKVNHIRQSALPEGHTTTSPIHITDLHSKLPFTSPVAGDVVEVFMPNLPLTDPRGSDSVTDLCRALGIEPDSWCELYKSPFVPEGHFPPWLPLREPMTVRQLLTFYVDISSCSYLLRPSFFQSLLRIHQNNARKRQQQDDHNYEHLVTLLETCASDEKGPAIFRSLMNSGKALCYPCLTDVLHAFPFIKVPLDRMLEMCSPLRARKFSVADYEMDSSGKCSALQICFRENVVDRSYNLSQCTPTGTTKEVAELFNGIAYKRGADNFLGHVTYRLSRTSINWQGKGNSHVHSLLAAYSGGYVGTSFFGKTPFALGLERSIRTIASTHSPRLVLLGAGTGIAPLMAAVSQLRLLRRQHLSEHTNPFPCSVIYGARNMSELIYHDDLSEALRIGAIDQYQFCLSRPQVTAATGVAHRYVTDILKKDAHAVNHLLTEGDGKFFACGPTKVLQSVRSCLANDILGEADDDDSMREQRLLFMEGKGQLFFDVWSTMSVF